MSSKLSSGSPDWVNPDYPPEMYLFFSVDIEGSTKFKNNVDGPTTWGPFFLDFFESFPATLEVEEVKAKVVGSEENEKFKIWKSLGDELLFYKKLNCGMDAFNGVLAVSLAIKQGSDKLRLFRESRAKAGDKGHYPTQLKGTAWVAGFPIKNLIIKKANEPMEFIGPSIDLGFRLAKFSSPSRMILSVPLAWIIAKIIENDRTPGQLSGRSLPIYYLGREALKGVEKVGIGYPIFWIDVSNSVHGLSKEERALISGWNAMSMVNIIAFCESLFDDPEINIGRPFIKNDNQYELGIPNSNTEAGKKYKKDYCNFLTAFPSVTADIQANSGTSSSAAKVISEIKNAVGRVGSRAAAKKPGAKKPAAKTATTKKAATKKPAAKK